MPANSAKRDWKLVLEDHARYWLAGLFIFLALLISVWDLWVSAHGQTRYTISWTLYEWSADVPMVAFALGVLTGHIFWPAQRPY